LKTTKLAALLILLFCLGSGCRNNAQLKDQSQAHPDISDSAHGPDSLAKAFTQSQYLEDSTVREENGVEVMHHLSTQQINKGNYFTPDWTSTLAVLYTVKGDTIWRLNDSANNMATKLDLIDDEFLITEKYSTHPPLACLMYQHTIDGLDPDSLILIMIQKRWHDT
jgi:hypothetical protein